MQMFGFGLLLLTIELNQLTVYEILSPQALQ